MTRKKPEVLADARFEHPRTDEASPFRGDMTIVRATHGIEAVRQVRGECGQRQVKDCEIALAHGNGGVLSSQSTVILGTAATV